MPLEIPTLPETHLQPLNFITEDDDTLVLTACVNAGGFVALVNSIERLQEYEAFASAASQVDIMLQTGTFSTEHFVFNGCVKTFLSYSVMDPFGSLGELDQANQGLQDALLSTPFGAMLVERYLDDPMAEHDLA